MIRLFFLLERMSETMTTRWPFLKSFFLLTKSSARLIVTSGVSENETQCGIMPQTSISLRAVDSVLVNAWMGVSGRQLLTARAV